MYCPFCHSKDTRVLDSRHLEERNTIRRRRKCESCSKRFSTSEKIRHQLPLVIKSDGRRESFDRKKILQGLTKACYKRPVPAGQIEKIVDKIEKNLSEWSHSEVSTRDIGNLNMAYLKHLDPVAYVRFASVYKTFKDIDEFVSTLD